MREVFDDALTGCRITLAALLESRAGQTYRTQDGYEANGDWFSSKGTACLERRHHETTAGPDKGTDLIIAVSYPPPRE